MQPRFYHKITSLLYEIISKLLQIWIDILWSSKVHDNSKPNITKIQNTKNGEAVTKIKGKLDLFTFNCEMCLK